MQNHVWSTFPRQLVQKINGLLDEAYPKPAKAFQIYKMCQSEKAWTESFSAFTLVLEKFYISPRSERSKGNLDRYLEKPLDCLSFEALNLTFRTAEVEQSSLRSIAEWAHHMLRLKYSAPNQLYAVDTFTETLRTITNPQFGEKDSDIDFDDFCDAWKNTADKLFGTKYQTQHQVFLKEVRELQKQVETFEIEQHQKRQQHQLSAERIYLTQTEIDWVGGVSAAVGQRIQTPKYPLTRGPLKPRLVELLKYVALYEISSSAQSSQVLTIREKLISHILSESEWLLSRCRR